MIGTTVVSTTTQTQATRIVADTTTAIDAALAAFPFDVAIVTCSWRVLMAYRELVELATHTERTVYLRPVAR